MSALADIVSGYPRAMRKADLRQVLVIENAAYQYPWGKGIFLDCIKAGYHCQVLQQPSGIAAYGIMSVGAGEAHILNLCVAPALMQQGLGRRLLMHLLQLAGRDKVHTVFLEVRPSNKAAIDLYSSIGFCELGVRPNYYPAPKGHEDALLMAKSL